MTMKPQVCSCLRCGYGWRTMRAGIPVKCPSCTSTSWNKPFERQPAGKTRLETPHQVIERLMKAAAEVLKTNSRCSVGKTVDKAYVVIPPLTLRKWRETPDRYGAVVAHLDRESTAEELGQALFGTRWLKRNQA